MLACGNGNSSNEQPNKPHTHYYGQWIINKSATCTQDGNKYRTCACGDTQRETITATGHTGVGVCSGCRVVFNDLLFDSINPKSYPFEYDSMLYQFNFSKDENSTITLNGTAKYTSSYAYLLGSYECTVNLKNDETWAYYTKYTTSNGSGGTVSCWIKGSVPLTKSAQFTKKKIRDSCRFIRWRNNDRYDGSTTRYYDQILCVFYCRNRPRNGRQYRT